MPAGTGSFWPRWESNRDQTGILAQKVREFLRFEQLEKAQLHLLVRRVEVDADRHITLYFNFTDPDQSS